MSTPDNDDNSSEARNWRAEKAEARMKEIAREVVTTDRNENWRDFEIDMVSTDGRKEFRDTLRFAKQLRVKSETQNIRLMKWVSWLIGSIVGAAEIIRQIQDWRSK